MKADTPLADVEFLATSPNRVTVLNRLADRPATRSELRDETGISQPTLGRILDGFLDRGWAVRNGHTYVLSRGGTLLADGFESLLETVETVRSLDAVEEHLPVERMPFDFREFRDATFVLPRPPDVEAHVRRAEELVAGASAVRSLSANMYLDAIPRQRDLIENRGQIQEVVIGAAAFDMALDHPSVVETIRGLLATDRLTVYATAEEIPVSLGLMDDVAAIVPYDDHGIPCALVETSNPTIRAWVVETLDEYRDRARRVTVEDLPAAESADG